MTRPNLKTPKAAAIAGIAFCILLLAVFYFSCAGKIRADVDRIAAQAHDFCGCRGRVTDCLWARVLIETLPAN